MEALEKVELEIQDIKKELESKDKQHDIELKKLKKQVLHQQKKISLALTGVAISILLYLYAGNSSIPESVKKQIDAYLALIVSGAGIYTATTLTSNFDEDD